MSEEEIYFWDGVTTAEGEPLSLEEQRKFVSNLIEKLVLSPELAKLFFNTQVYNEFVNGVTTRGDHSKGVAIVAAELARIQVLLDEKTEDKAEDKADIAALLAKALGYMHDLGHTPFGHDGEAALNSEMERFEATQEYKEKRKKLYGDKYTKAAKDVTATRMCYEHNETSSIIGSRMVSDFVEAEGYCINEYALQYIKDGILAHSTSRVKEEPQGIEQKSVRLADKVAYIPQDLLDLLKQGVIKIDDLTQEEQGLLGLDEEILTRKEQTHYDMLPLEEKEKYKNKCKEEKRQLKNKLRQIGTLNDEVRDELIELLDEKVQEMQAEIATKCFIQEDGKYKLDGRKKTIDRIAKFVNDKEAPPEKEVPLSKEELEAAELFRTMRYAQKNQHQKDIATAAKAYRQYLIEHFNMDPIIATLWVTKAKYQDSFIKNELKKTNEDGTLETLGDINEKEENAWKMKVTFQYFYSHIDQIPEYFKQKYSNREFTDQQMVSIFIASFTNNGLNELYNGLLEKKLVLSRTQAMKMLKEARPDLDVDKLTSKTMKFQTTHTDANGETEERTEKVSANDILEQLVEENCGISIVSGKNKDANHEIPPHRFSKTVREIVEYSADKLVERRKPEALTSLIDVSKTEVNDQDIRQMVQSVIDRQNTQEIQNHINNEQSERG